jgi:hypothetical protein
MYGAMGLINAQKLEVLRELPHRNTGHQVVAQAPAQTDIRRFRIVAGMLAVLTL